MSAPLRSIEAAERARPIVDADETYIRHRVVDALLRENVRECVSRAVVHDQNGLPGARATAPAWLEVGHFGGGVLWIPVTASRFMQVWRGTGEPLVWDDGQVHACLETVDDVVAAFARGLGAEAAAHFAAFAEECRVAVVHRRVSEAERERWFESCRAAHGRADGTCLPNWHARLLHYDRVAAFLDHPLYPTARAKLGFDGEALAAYGPEFQRPFLLRWLAVPRELHHPGEVPDVPGAGGPLPWPGMEDVGLPSALTATHALIPVHPFVWDNGLDAFLKSSGLHARVMRAPDPWLAVTPTLSVRTVVLLDAPDWHLKLPLTIRTLGAKNIRTIKPSTIGDGHRFQTLLSGIVAREAALVDRLLLTDEQLGAHADRQPFLGYILRRYPAEALRESTLVPVAALLARTPGNDTVFAEAAAAFYDGDLEAFFNDYVDLTLRLHLTLWLRYGVALESNQQNSILVLQRQTPRLRLLLKDNDAGRIRIDDLNRRWPELAQHVADLEDRRILVLESTALSQMFTTITLQLNIAVLVEGLAAPMKVTASELYHRVRMRIESILDDLAREGEDVSSARDLLDVDYMPIKYLLTAATLAEKNETGAADVNKFYGFSAPNFLKAS